MNKLFGPLMALGLVGLVIFFATTDGSSVDTAQFFTKGELTDIQEKDFQVGTGEVQIVEYGDFECPACGAFYTVTKQIKEELAEDSTFAYRHLPLSSIHPRAMAAHRASEAAGMQGKFFEMHDLMYENQSEWGTGATANLTGALEVIEGYAEELGLDMEKYRADVNSALVAENIKVHLESAGQVGANSTPTIFVNGEKINYYSGFTFEDMEKIVENAKAGKPLQSDEEQDADAVESTEPEEVTAEDESQEAEESN